MGVQLDAAAGVAVAVAVAGDAAADPNPDCHWAHRAGACYGYNQRESAITERASEREQPSAQKIRQIMVL